MNCIHFLLPFVVTGIAAAAPAPRETAICVYGGTSGAVVAAVQAKKSGKDVILLSPDKHLGGLTSGGLGWTDLGDERILGGLSLSFYQKVYDHYSQEAAWDLQARAKYGNAGQGTKAMNDIRRTMSVFEPKVAEAVFNAWIEENHVPVIHARLDRSASGLVKEGGRITSIRTEDGQTIRAKVFIDATYEGDLMALAGVSYTVGREPNSRYQETLNGIQTARATGNQLPKGIDPYVKPGDAASGLLPGVREGAGGADGSGDKRVQAYCYRMCLTNHAPNRVMVKKPEGYNEADYELVFRAIEAGQTKGFFKLDPLPNHKTDSNNSGGISTDLLTTADDAYPDGDYATRERIAKQHENWQRGLVWTLQNHPRVSEAIRKAYAAWGLPRDEFVDTGHWPHALYVREARRMTSDFVMTQATVTHSEGLERSVGMGAYGMDSHNMQRHVGGDGFVRNEGDVQVKVPRPYRIDYGAIVPKKTECPNLLVTFCVSASHIAFGSIRMEPVFMALSQSAATAASLAIDGNTAVQDVPYGKLKEQLLKDGQKLTLE
ncbi:FAD-dependent oxidoreductase [Luteolibacter ambystomatis]|uniref:FAD-dependent oxidoreductase n=1 Tax=Luteolibacter ambystomatis TaxID=2824561 RepID=A0A975G6L9_9BACT|nr:FAD-dependent oxidoreductase [Luteolibacter ambystomatis]QUE50049.1 FAD-dependent oxidoreductase [Luteolibacter ambystomatis]